MTRKVEVVPYDPAWPAIFKGESRLLKGAMGRNCMAIWHIGSTAVPGMMAKPVIDILVAVKDLEQVDACSEKMEELGYEALGENGIPGRRFFRKGGVQPTHHVHVYENTNQAEIQRHLAVVEYLAANEKRREEYSELKSYLAAAYPEDIDGYIEGKAYFVSQLEQEALNSREEKTEEESTGRSLPMSLGMCLGLVLGLTVFDNIGVGLCIGMCLGLAVSRLKKD